jgi:hypothetical protein
MRSLAPNRIERRLAEIPRVALTDGGAGVKLLVALLRENIQRVFLFYDAFTVQ